MSQTQTTDINKALAMGMVEGGVFVFSVSVSLL